MSLRSILIYCFFLFLLLLVFVGFWRFFDRDKEYYLHGIEVVINKNSLLIPRGYFEGFYFPKNKNLDYVYLWFLLPDMEPYSRDNKEYFMTWKNRSPGVVRVMVRSSEGSSGDNYLSCRKEYDESLIRCVFFERGFGFEISFPGFYEGDIDRIIEKVTRSFFGFIENN